MISVIAIWTSVMIIFLYPDNKEIQHSNVLHKPNLWTGSFCEEVLVGETEENEEKGEQNEEAEMGTGQQMHTLLQFNLWIFLKDLSHRLNVQAILIGPRQFRAMLIMLTFQIIHNNAQNPQNRRSHLDFCRFQSDIREGVCKIQLLSCM